MLYNKNTCRPDFGTCTGNPARLPYNNRHCYTYAYSKSLTSTHIYTQGSIGSFQFPPCWWWTRPYKRFCVPKKVSDYLRPSFSSHSLIVVHRDLQGWQYRKALTLWVFQRTGQITICSSNRIQGIQMNSFYVPSCRWTRVISLGHSNGQLITAKIIPSMPSCVQHTHLPCSLFSPGSRFRTSQEPP